MVATPALLSRNNPLKKPGFDSYEEYHPYGTTAWQAPSLTTVSLKRYKYTGMERDEETGLQRHGVRYYATWLGRWTSADPIGLGDGVNRFHYGLGSPVGRRDTSGTTSFIAILGCGGDAGEGASGTSGAATDDGTGVTTEASAPGVCSATGDSPLPPSGSALLPPQVGPFEAKSHMLHISDDIETETALSTAEVRLLRAEVWGLIETVLEFRGDPMSGPNDEAQLETALTLLMETDAGLSLVAQVLKRADVMGKNVVMRPGFGDADETATEFVASWDPSLPAASDSNKPEYSRSNGSAPFSLTSRPRGVRLAN